MDDATVAMFPEAADAAGLDWLARRIRQADYEQDGELALQMRRRLALDFGRAVNDDGQLAELSPAGADDLAAQLLDAEAELAAAGEAAPVALPAGWTPEAEPV